MSAAPERRSLRGARAALRVIVGAVAALALAVAPAVLTATPAQAATAQVSITPSATSVESNVAATFAVSITCNGPGTCDNTEVTFPANAVTGNGARTDLSTWVSASSCLDVTRSVSGGLVRFSYGSVPNGTRVCEFRVTAPEYTTLNGAQATLTPTISGSTFPTSTGAPAVLTLVAGHNVSLQYTAPASVISTGEFTYNLRLICGENRQYTGDIGISRVRVEAVLPANFVFAGYTIAGGMPGTITAPTVGASGGTFVYDDPTGATCGNPPLNIDNSMLINIRGSITGPTGTQGCSTASADFTYIDRTTADTASAAPAACQTVANLNTTVTKGTRTTSMANSGQHGPAGQVYTYPGDWDTSGGSVYYDLVANTSPAATNAGVSYLVQDPMPCLDTLSGTTYSSNAVGSLCLNPGFIPTRIQAFGFTPTAGDTVVLRLTDGSTSNVTYTAGAWTIPAGLSVAQVDIQPFASQGSNTAAVQFRLWGRAAPAAVPGNLLRNTVSSTPHLVSSGDPLRTAQTASSNLYVADPVGANGTIIQPSLFTNYQGACIAQARLNNPGAAGAFANRLEITTAPSASLHFDYLAPAGATVSGTTLTFTASGMANGRTFNLGARTPAVTADYNGTGRTLYQWTIPAGLITAPGAYVLNAGIMSVNLGAGCAGGTFENDLTIGYGSAAQSCLAIRAANGGTPAVNTRQTPPLLPVSNADLSANGVGTSNFCGYSAPVSVDALNEGFTLTKTVQGNLDAGPVPVDVDGSVSPAGGVATYRLSFTNSGESVLTDPVAYDILPRVGDTTAISTDARGSDFAVTLTSMGAVSAGVVVSYSTAANPCRVEVLPVNAGCVDDWSTTPPSPLSTTTALRFVYSGTVAVGAGFTAAFDVATPAVPAGNVALNSVGATATAGGSLMTPAESVIVGLTAGHAMPEVAKAASVPTYDADGETITFTYTVTNNTAVPLTGVSVDDAFTDAASGSTPPTVTCVELTNPAAACSGASTSLAAGQIATFTATYTTRQEDVDHGLITDVATVSAQPPTGSALASDSNAVTVTAVQSPALTLDKGVSPTTVDAAGDVVGYTFLVTNTGNVTLTTLTIQENAFGGTGGIPATTCPLTTLAPGADTTCTASYTITQGDMDGGTFDNTAVARALFDGDPVLSLSSSATVTVTQTPSLDLEKSALPATIGSAGQAIVYSFLVTNDGNVTIDEIEVQETLFSGSDPLDPVVCPATSLAPGLDMTCTATYSATQVDIDAGEIENTATAVGDDPTGDPVATQPSSFTVDVILAPAMTLVKTADVARVTRAGDVISYEFLVLNNGNTTLDDLQIDELTFTGAGTLGTIDCPVTTLAPTDQTTCTADYTVVAADAGGSRISNTAQALATYALGGVATSVTSADSTADVAVAASVTPGLAVTGSSVPRWLPTLAAGLLLAGAVLLAVARRRPLEW